MKKIKDQPTPKPLSLAGETTQAGEKAANVAARLSDPAHRYHTAAASHDGRRHVAAGVALQRLRARQSESR